MTLHKKGGLVMLMTIHRWITALRERIRAFLGLDVLPTRLELVQLRDDIAKNHRDVLEALVKLSVAQNLNHKRPLIENYKPQNLSWEMVQAIELANMLENPPKED